MEECSHRVYTLPGSLNIAAADSGGLPPEHKTGSVMWALLPMLQMDWKHLRRSDRQQPLRRRSRVFGATAKSERIFLSRPTKTELFRWAILWLALLWILIGGIIKSGRNAALGFSRVIGYL